MASRPGPATRPLTIHSASLHNNSESLYKLILSPELCSSLFSAKSILSPPHPTIPFCLKNSYMFLRLQLKCHLLQAAFLDYHPPPPRAGSGGFLGFPLLLLLPLTALITALYKSLFSSLSPRRASTVPDFFTMNSRYKHRAWHIVAGQKVSIELWLNPVASTRSQSPLRSSFFAHKSQPNSGWRILAGIRFPSQDCLPPDSFPC